MENKILIEKGKIIQNKFNEISQFFQALGYKELNNVIYNEGINCRYDCFDSVLRLQNDNENLEISFNRHDRSIIRHYKLDELFEYDSGAYETCGNHLNIKTINNILDKLRTNSYEDKSFRMEKIRSFNLKCLKQILKRNDISKDDYKHIQNFITKDLN